MQKVNDSIGATYIGSNTEKFAFIYKLEPDQFWEVSRDYKVHLGCQMSCTSLSNLSKFKLPLDKEIQKSVWKNRYLCSQGFWRLSEEDYLISILVKCIF